MSDEFGPIVVAPPEPPGEHPDAVFGPIVPPVEPYPQRYYVHYNPATGEIIAAESHNATPCAIDGTLRLEHSGPTVSCHSHRVDLATLAIVPLG